MVNSSENDTNLDADACNTKYISMDNSTEDDADTNLEDGVYSGCSHKTVST